MGSQSFQLRLLENLNTAVVVHTPDTQVIYSNRRASAILGLSTDQIRGKMAVDLAWHFITEQGIAIALDDYPVNRVISSRQSFDNLVLGIVTPQKSEPIWVLVGGFPEFDPNGDLIQVVVNFHDISEQKKIEQALRNSESAFRGTFNQAAVGIAHVGLDGAWLKVNSKLCGIVGYSEDELMKLTFQEITYPDDLNIDLNYVKQMLAGEIKTYSMEKRYFKNSGELTWINLTVSLVLTDDERPDYFISVVEDINERKRYECKMLNSSRALATLSAVNHLLVHSTNELELLSSLCQAIVKHSGYHMAWVGYLEYDEARTIRVVAKNGFEDGYLERAAIVWSDSERGSGPTGVAARSGTTQVVQNFRTDDRVTPWREEAEKRGYAASICLPLILDEKVFGVLTIYSGYADTFTKEEVKLLEEMAGDLAFGVKTLRIRHERDMGQLQIKEQLAKLETNLEDTVAAISTIVELRDPYTAGHERRVAELAVTIAREMGLTDVQIKGIYLGGMVHDLGKIQVPAEILSTPRRLSEIEYKLVQCHPQAGYDILKDIDFPWPIAQMVLQHHERQDGSGYPQGLKGEAIMLEARILCVADVVEAMASHRPYRAGLGIDRALAEIKRGSDTIYDPNVADACLKVFAEGKFKL